MIVITTTDARAAWAKKIADQWRDSVTAILKVGVTLGDAKAALSAADFAEMIANDLPFGERAARMFIAIGQSDRLRKHASALPASWYSLYELQRLPEKLFEKAVKDGRIHPDMERKEIALLHEQAQPPRSERKHASAQPRDAEWTEAAPSTKTGAVADVHEEPEPSVEDELDEDPQNYVTAYWLRVDTARRFAVYAKGPLTSELAVAAREVAAAWIKLAEQMEVSLERGAK